MSAPGSTASVRSIEKAAPLSTHVPVMVQSDAGSGLSTVTETQVPTSGGLAVTAPAAASSVNAQSANDSVKALGSMVGGLSLAGIVTTVVSGAPRTAPTGFESTMEKVSSGSATVSSMSVTEIVFEVCPGLKTTVPEAAS